jgi:LPS export ABC transporter permease LptG/LPS export ABC transporter permease LptF
MKLIDRYLLREVLPYVGLALLLLTSVIFLHEANRFSELFVVFARQGLAAGPLVSLLVSVLPGIFVYTIPYALLFGVLLGLGRLSADSEMTALRASGISRRRLMLPLALLGLVAAAFMAYLTFDLAPQAQRTISALKRARGESLYRGLVTELKPRVFGESIPGKIFYVQEIDRHSSEWRNVFIADTTTGGDDEMVIRTARVGRLARPAPGEELPEFHLNSVQVHTAREVKRRNKVQYNVESVEEVTIRFESSAQDPMLSEAPRLPSLDHMDLATLFAYEGPSEQQLDHIVEIHKRFALPASCLIFSVVGLAFGVFNQRTGRSYGLIVGLLLTVVYFVMLLGGEKAARSGALPPWLGIWGPNLVFVSIGVWASIRQRLPGWTPALARMGIGRADTDDDAAQTASAAPAVGPGLRFGLPRLIDRMILAELGRNVLFIVGSLTVVFLTFTLFELVGEIVENQTPPGVVTAYVLYLAPQIVHYMIPLSVLVGVMVTFGVLAGGSQIVALKASGQSIYRLAVPVFALATVLAGLVFVMQEYVLPVTNREQEALRQTIRSGKEPPRTVHQLDQQWIFGIENRIFHYRHFDPDTNRFAELSIFDLDPATFEVRRRVFASAVTWDQAAGGWLAEYGWIREFDEHGVGVADSFRQQLFTIPEGPDYFKRPVSAADTMSFQELSHQIAELSRGGFDVLALRIDLQRKVALPLTCVVMALVGLPFAFSIGRRGALYGVAVGLAFGLVFWGMLGLFAQMGRYEILPPVLAAWGPNLLFGAGGAYLFLTART